MPGERLERGIQNVFVLGEDEGLILRANESFRDEVRLQRQTLYRVRTSLEST